MEDEEKNELIRKLSKEAEAYLACGDTDAYYKLVAQLGELQKAKREPGEKMIRRE